MDTNTRFGCASACILGTSSSRTATCLGRPLILLLDLKVLPSLMAWWCRPLYEAPSPGGWRYLSPTSGLKPSRTSRSRFERMRSRPDLSLTHLGVLGPKAVYLCQIGRP